MTVPDDLEPYAWKSVLAALKEGLPVGTKLNMVGTRPDNDDKEWYNYSPMGDARMRTRKGVYGGLLLFEVQCCSRLEESRPDHDTLAPFTMASKIRKLLEKTDLPVRTIGVDPETILGVLQIKEAQQSYLPRRNITFEGEGNFAVEQGNSHSVVVTFRAVLIASA